MYKCFKFSIIFYMVCNSARRKYFENPVQLRTDFMQANCWDWCPTSISTFHNIAEKSVPNYSCKLLAVCALVKGVFICDCGKYNITQVEVTVDIGEEGWCYFRYNCGYKGALKSGVSDRKSEISESSCRRVNRWCQSYKVGYQREFFRVLILKVRRLCRLKCILIAG